VRKVTHILKGHEFVTLFTHFMAECRLIENLCSVTNKIQTDVPMQIDRAEMALVKQLT